MNNRDSQMLEYELTCTSSYTDDTANDSHKIDYGCGLGYETLFSRIFRLRCEDGVLASAAHTDA